MTGISFPAHKCECPSMMEIGSHLWLAATKKRASRPRTEPLCHFVSTTKYVALLTGGQISIYCKNMLTTMGNDFSHYWWWAGMCRSFAFWHLLLEISWLCTVKSLTTKTKAKELHICAHNASPTKTTKSWITEHWGYELNTHLLIYFIAQIVAYFITLHLLPFPFNHDFTN